MNTPKPKKRSRPARYVGQAADEKQSKARRARGLPSLALVPDKGWVCTGCAGPCSETEYRNNNHQCVRCWLKN